MRFMPRRQTRQRIATCLIAGLPWIAWTRLTADEPQPPSAIEPSSAKIKVASESDTTGDEPGAATSPEEMRVLGVAPVQGKVVSTVELSPSEPPPEPAGEAVEVHDADATPDGGEVRFDAASLKGVHPGQTTREQLHALWGQPKKIEKIAGGVRETFTLQPLDRVRVTITENVVESFAIHLQNPLAVKLVVERLQLEDVEPIEAVDDAGEVLGQAYPERGVLLGFALKRNPPHVFQVIVEPIDAEPFLARAEARLSSRYADCLADLNQAMKLQPDSVRAYALHADLMLAQGDLEQGLASARKAVELAPNVSDYRLTLAALLAARSEFPHATQIVRTIVETEKPAPLTLARAYCQWGDYTAAPPARDHQQAIQYHMQAIKLAEALAASPSVTVRRAAKKLLLAAHLAVAHDIGWGRWQHKQTVVPRWIERARLQADDIIAHEQGSATVRFFLHEKTLAAWAGVVDPPDLAASIRAAAEAGKRLIETAVDPAFKAHISWRLAVALGDAVEIENASKHADRALEWGTLAMTCFEHGEPAGKQWPNHHALRGRLCYRLGAIHAIERKDHLQAVAWFDRAVPLLETPLPPSAAVDAGRQGETFVSMAVSYWEAGNRPESLRLTRQGVKLMERAVAEGLLDRAALVVPYGNLASMHEQLGESNEAREFSELASRFEAALRQ